MSDIYRQARFRDMVLGGVEPFPGALVVGIIRAPREGMVGNKPRPVILSRQRPAGDWLAWGLTTKPNFKDGNPREVAPGVHQVGLAEGFIFGGHAVVIPADDILGVIWAAPREMIFACARNESGMPRGQAGPISDQLHEQHVADGWTWPKPKGGLNV